MKAVLKSKLKRPRFIHYNFGHFGFVLTHTRDIKRKTSWEFFLLEIGTPGQGGLDGM